MTVDDEQEADKKVQELVSWFFTTLSIVITAGLLTGVFCVCFFAHQYQKRQNKRLQEAQSNPAFKFQDTHDPSGTAGGIPASNPIADDVMQTDAYNTNNAVPTDRGLNVQTDRNLMDSPDPRRRAYAKQTSDVPLNNNEEKVADNRQ